jgi:hypothetical protein
METVTFIWYELIFFKQYVKWRAKQDIDLVVIHVQIKIEIMKLSLIIDGVDVHVFAL